MGEPHTAHFPPYRGSGDTHARLRVRAYIIIARVYTHQCAILYIRKRIIQICSGGMSISLAITVIIISVNWIAIFRYIRAYIENYTALSSRISPRRRETIPLSPIVRCDAHFSPLFLPSSRFPPLFSLFSIPPPPPLPSLFFRPL